MSKHIGSILFILAFLTSGASWITHLYRCFTEEQWGFLIGGALFFPIGIVHGFGILIGAW